MSNTPAAPETFATDLQDDDLLLIFRSTGAAGRRRVVRGKWRDLKAFFVTQGPKGKDGRDGRDGLDGLNGTNGTNGTNGKDGTNGTNGRDGLDGLNGFDGKNGVNGKDGTNGTNGKDGLKGDTGPAGLPKRIELVTGKVTKTNGVAEITFATPFAVAPVGMIVVTWVNKQMVTGDVTSITTTKATLLVMKSQGTILLNASVFDFAPVDTPVTLLLLGN